MVPPHLTCKCLRNCWRCGCSLSSVRCARSRLQSTRPDWQPFLVDVSEAMSRKQSRVGAMSTQNRWSRCCILSGLRDFVKVFSRQRLRDFFPVSPFERAVSFASSTDVNLYALRKPRAGWGNKGQLSKSWRTWSESTPAAIRCRSRPKLKKKNRVESGKSVYLEWNRLGISFAHSR